MSTIQVQIVDNWDDGRQEHVGCAGWNQGAPQAVQSNSASIRHDGFWYFRAVTIPRESTINFATFTVIADNNIAGMDPVDEVMWIRVEDNGAPVPPTGVDDICSRTFWSRIIQPNNHRVGIGGSITEYIDANIQHVVGLEDWAEDGILILWEAGESSLTKILQWVGHNQDPPNSGALYVDYTEPESPGGAKVYDPIGTSAVISEG